MINKLYDKFKKMRAIERSGLINMGLKPISMFLALLYTPLLLNYLDDEKFGLWVTLLSIINWINYFDVGIGNGLRNLLTKEIADRDFNNAQKSISTAYISLSFIAGVIYIILLVSLFFFDWKKLLSTSIDVDVTLFICFTSICLNFVLALSNIVFYSLQCSEKVSIRNCIVQLLNIIGICVVSKFFVQNLVAVAVVFGLSSLVLYLYNTILIIQKNNYLKPSFKFYDSKKIKDITAVGIKFFIIQVFGLLIFTVDNLLITHYFGATSVTPFSVSNKAFNALYSVLAAFLLPYWSGSVQAFKNGDRTSLIKSIKKVLFVFLLFVVAYILLALLFKPLSFLWLGKELFYPHGLILVTCLFYIFYSLLAVNCQFINGSGKINVQLWLYLLIGSANIPLSIYLGVNQNMGAVGIKLASTILVFIAIVILSINLKRIIDSLR